MSLKHTIELVIKAQDEASKKVKEVENQMKKFSTSSKTSMNHVNSQLSNMDKYFQGINGRVTKFGTNAVKTFAKMTNAEKQTAMGIIKISENVSQGSHAWDHMSNSTLKWKDHVKLAQTYVQGLGVETNSLKGKVMTLSLAFSSKLGSSIESVKIKLAPLTNAFNPIITKVNGLATTIKTKVGAAIDSLKSKFGIFKASANGTFKGLENGANNANKSIGLLGATISNFAGMVIYDFFMGIVQAGKSAINAASQLDYFAKRLENMEGKTHLTTQQFKKFKADLGGLQKEFRKVDMTAVGASAEELAVKLQLPSESLTGLSETIAVTSSAFVKEGRTQEDAILAVSDALDGQFMKLKELGITQAELKENGWNGDLNDKQSLLEGLNNTLEKMGFADTARDITTVDEAMSALTIAGGQLLQKIFVPLTPILINIVEAFISVTDVVGPLIENFVNLVSKMPDWAKYAILVGGFAISIGLLVSSMGGLTEILMTLGMKIAPVITLIGGISWPLVAVVAAIGLVAVAVYELGKHFGWWKDIPSMIQAVTAGLQRLWSAFINNPDVQDFIKGLGDAWNSVTKAISPVIDAIMEFLGLNTESKEEFDIVRAIIDGLGAAFHKVADAVRFAIGVFQTIYGVFQGIASFLAPYGQMIYDALKPIVCILLGCSPGIVPALEKVQEVFQTVWSFIAGFIGSYVSTVVSIISTVVTTVMSVINVFGQLLSGQISLSEAIPMIWNLISSAFTTILGTIITFVTTWAGNLYKLAVRAATNFVNSIINKIRGLPSTVYGFIKSTAGKIRDGAATWATNARNAATNTVNGVVTNIQGLPGKVYQEFIGIGSRIKEAAAHVVQQASNFANGIKNKILDILGIHSPGILQKKIGIEFTDISTKSIGEKASLAYENAKNFASNIITGFESEDLSSLEVTPSINANTPNMALTGVTPQLEAPDTTAITDTVTTAYDTMNAIVGTDLSSLQSMNTDSFTNISANEEAMMKKIYNHVNSTLSTILKTNKSSLSSNVNTTKTQLSKMHNSTKTVTGQMVTAWNGMKNSIVAAARKIDSDATAHFNTLGKTIGGFYGKLQNPGRWGTGPGPEEERRTRRGTGRGVRSVSGNAMRAMSRRLAEHTVQSNNMPRTISVKSVRNNPTFKGLTDFISDGSNIDVRTLFETGVLSPFNLAGLSRSAFGAWENTAKPNIDKIKSTARNWSMKGPKLAGRVSSGLTFHVKDFENGTPRIGMSDFINMAYALVNSTSYGYYADSSRYGSWLNALNHGEMNCSDGSDMLIALARTCGLPAEKVHCYWGTSSSGIAGTSKGEGHFVARIGGRIMDSVSMRHGSLTSPKVHGYGTGPSPFKSLRETGNNDAGYAGSEDIKLDGKIEIIHKHEFEGLPEGIDEAKLARMINDAPNDERFVKQLANNIKFQVADHRAKVRFERKGNRSKGLGA